MKHIGKFTGLALSTVAALSMVAPAFASDYSFTTTAPQDYYGSTSYEDVYGSRYNYGGKNVVDCQALELEYGLLSSTQTEAMERTAFPGLQETVVVVDGVGYGISDNGGAVVTIPNVSIATTPIVQQTVYQQPAYTSVESKAYQDGSIGTLSIPKLGINMKVWEGETNASMAKGVAHYSSTSGWAGNIGLCGHNRGAKYVIGSIKDLKQGDIITYTTIYGTRTYQITTVQIIPNTDWSYLQPTADNRITITTCLADHPESRVLVQAVEKM